MAQLLSVQGLTATLSAGSVSTMNTERHITSQREPEPASLSDARSWFYFYFNPPAVLAGREVLVH